MQYVAFESDIEILGAAVLATVAGFGPFQSIIEGMLEREGLARGQAGRRGRIDAEQWYSQQSWLDALREVEERFGTHVLRKIGAQIPATAVFPDDVRDIHSGLQSIDVAYHLNHRRAGRLMFDGRSGTMLEGIGHYGYERVADTQVRVRCQTPYPCAFDLGIVESMARRFVANAEVRHVPGACRSSGEEYCEYQVRWR